MAEPNTGTTQVNADAAAVARARAEFNAQRGLAFKPDATVEVSPFDFSGPSSMPILEALRNRPALSSQNILLSPAVRDAAATPPAPHASVQAQAAAAAAPAVSAGVGPTAAAPAAGNSSAVLANAIEVLAAMTGKSADDVRRAIVPEGHTMPDQGRIKDFMTQNSAAIANAQRPENIARMSQGQRDAIRQFLQQMGVPLAPDAQGATPQQQAQSLSQGFQNAQEGGMDPASMMMMLILGALAEAFGMSGAFNNVLGMMGGQNTRGYRTGTGGMGSARSGAARFSSEPELERIAAGVQGRGTLQGVVNLANALDGQREVGNNGGAIVRATMGYTGDPWCGGYLRYTFEKAGVTGVYDQSDYRMARSYMHIGQRHGAFRGGQSGYQPQPGDVIVFSSSRGPNSGHVGLVTAVNNGQITYSSGNDGDQVQSRTFSASRPPGNLLGYTDTQALARAKGVTLERAPTQQAAVTAGTSVTAPSAPAATPPVPRASSAPMRRDF